MTKRGWFIGAAAVAVAALLGVGAVLSSASATPKDEVRFSEPQDSVRVSPSTPPPTPSSPAPEPEPEPEPTPSPEPAPEPVPPPVVEDGDPPVQPAPVPQGGPCATSGPSQLVVEQYLATRPEFGQVSVDGVQSETDCAAIAAFQDRYGIYGAPGLAGPVTGDVATRLANVNFAGCAVTSSPTICLDLTTQTMWVVTEGVVVLGPTVVRTGRAGLETPSGQFTITEKLYDTISTIYHVPLPRWQRFVSDIGFHTTPSYLHEGPGSHGCVNLLPTDSDRLWELTTIGTAVSVFGRKPGT